MPAGKGKAKDTASETTAISDFVMKPKRATSAWIFYNTETVAKLKEKEGLE
jgi:hypothetical protein